jgi:hypothetical protein
VPGEKPADTTDDSKKEEELEELRSQLREQAETNARLAGQVETLTSTVTGLQSTPQTPDPDPDPITNEVLEADPEATLDQHFQRKITPLLQQQARVNAANNRENARSKFGDEFKKYEKEIDSVASKMTLEALQSPGSYENIVNHVRAQHLPEIIEESVKAELTKREQEAQGEGSTGLPSAAGGSAAAAEGATKLPGVDDDEAAVAAKFGKTPEQWAKAKARRLEYMEADRRERLGISKVGA